VDGGVVPGDEITINPYLVCRFHRSRLTGVDRSETMIPFSALGG
jgi:hypothetical protein